MGAFSNSFAGLWRCFNRRLCRRFVLDRVVVVVVVVVCTHTAVLLLNGRCRLSWSVGMDTVLVLVVVQVLNNDYDYDTVDAVPDSALFTAVCFEPVLIVLLLLVRR